MPPSRPRDTARIVLAGGATLLIGLAVALAPPPPEPVLPRRYHYYYLASTGPSPRWLSEWVALVVPYLPSILLALVGLIILLVVGLTARKR